MKRQKNKRFPLSDKLRQVAEDPKLLDTRSSINEKLGNFDLDKWILEIAKLKPGMSVLDIGCGTGKQYLKFLEEIGTSGRIIGLDASEEMINKLNAELPYGLSNATTTVGKMENIEDIFSGEKFDLIHSAYALYNGETPIDTIKQICSLTIDGGKFLVVGPYGKNQDDFYKDLGNCQEVDKRMVWNSQKFMEEIVIPKVKLLYGKVNTYTASNVITFSKLDDLMAFWRSNYFNKDTEECIKEMFNKKLIDNGKYVLIKHIMTVEAIL